MRKEFAIIGHQRVVAAPLARPARGGGCRIINHLAGWDIWILEPRAGRQGKGGRPPDLPKTNGFRLSPLFEKSNSKELQIARRNSLQCEAPG